MEYSITSNCYYLLNTNYQTHLSTLNTSCHLIIQATSDIYIVVIILYNNFSKNNLSQITKLASSKGGILTQIKLTMLLINILKEELFQNTLRTLLKQEQTNPKQAEVKKK